MQLTTICESTENFIDYKFAAGSVWNLIKFVTVQYLTVTFKNPFQIGYADGIFAF